MDIILGAMGCPEPFLIHTVMGKAGIPESAEVISTGDTSRGVLTGHLNEE
ncbi:hypothetical protein [Corynebacterium stationis]|nr:hypothetical protein [Corynebacterium stationis]